MEKENKNTDLKGNEYTIHGIAHNVTTDRRRRAGEAGLACFLLLQKS